MSSALALPQVAFLGPSGSYTEQALLQHFSPEKLVPCYSVAEVFHLVRSGAVPFGFVPMENSLQGPVSETLDLLFEYKGGLQIRTSVTLRIAHCLGALSSGAAIRAIYAHEQAIRQCARFLRERYPNAELLPQSSNSAAADLIKERKLPDAAVIAGKETLLARGFTILAENIADEDENYTRFALISGKSMSPELQAQLARDAGESEGAYVTSIVVDPGRDRQGLLYELLQVISVTHQVNLLSIHSRPDRRGGFVFHLDLEGNMEDERIRACLADLERYCLQHTGSTAQIINCGSYTQRRFQSLPFRTVGIIGGGGVMGRWFSRFFREAGLEVLVSDPTVESPSPAELAERSDVLLISVPMSAAEGVIRSMAPALRAGQLLVENCSLKGVALQTLLEAAPAGAEVLGIHTMFSGDIPTLRGENVLITRTPRSGVKSQALEDLFYKFGARLTDVEEAAHDKASAVTQAVIHLSALTLGELLTETFPNAAALEPFNTANSRAVLSVIQRVASLNEDLLCDIQLRNKEAIRARHRLVELFFSLVAALDHDDRGELMRRLEKVRSFLTRQ